MKFEKNNCVVCGREFLIKKMGKGIPTYKNLKVGTIFRRKGCVTCSKLCSRENVRLRVKNNKRKKE